MSVYSATSTKWMCCWCGSHIWCLCVRWPVSWRWWRLTWNVLKNVPNRENRKLCRSLITLIVWLLVCSCYVVSFCLFCLEDMHYCSTLSLLFLLFFFYFVAFENIQPKETKVQYSLSSWTCPTNGFIPEI